MGNSFILWQIYSSAVCSVKEAHLKTKMLKIQYKVHCQYSKTTPNHIIWGIMSKHGTAELYFHVLGTIINDLKYVQLH